MSGDTTQQQTQTQQSSTQPWTAAQPLLKNILGQLGTSPMGPNSNQTASVQQLLQEAGMVPSFGNQGTNAVNNLFNVNTDPQQAAIGNAAGALTPFLNKDFMNPATNPYLGPAMETLNSDITNSISGQFAAAGRPIGSNAAGAQALARGLSQGEAGLLTNEFNTLGGMTQSAAGMMPGIQSAMTSQQMSPLTAGLSGIQGAGSIPGLLTQPGIANLSAAGLEAGLPTMNLQMLESLGIPIAGLGAESQGTMSGTTTQQGNLLSNIIGGTLGGVGLLGGTGAFGSSGWLAPLMMSDERVKDDVEQVGELYDETPVYSFKYKGDETPRVGLLAQDIEKVRPDAVVNFPSGLKAVDYGKATERSRHIGMLSKFLEAA